MCVLGKSLTVLLRQKLLAQCQVTTCGHHLPPEKPSALGEKIAGELDKLEDEDYFFTSDYVWTRRQPHQYPDGTPVVSVEAVITAGE